MYVCMNVCMYVYMIYMYIYVCVCFQTGLGEGDHKINNNTTLQGCAEDACQALHASGSESTLQRHQRNLDILFIRITILLPCGLRKKLQLSTDCWLAWGGWNGLDIGSDVLKTYQESEKKNTITMEWDYPGLSTLSTISHSDISGLGWEGGPYDEMCVGACVASD